jgi:hypothetical protein
MASKIAGGCVAHRTEEEQVLPAQESPRPRRRWWQRAWFKVLVVLVVVGLAAGVIAVEWAIHHAEPIIRARVVETLSARFHAPVQLDHLGISLVKGVALSGTGVAVEGDGLRIGYPAEADDPVSGHGAPMVAVDHFAFTTRLKGLLHSPTRVSEVVVNGMELHIPPPERRRELFGQHTGRHGAKITLLVAEIICRNAKLYIDTTKPGKDPLEFDIQNLDLRDIGESQPFLYRAELINPKPIGEVHAEGHFGPWNADDPRETALDGSYSFSHADLNTIKGIGGMLSSHGEFSGILDHINIDGETETPNFSLDVSDHPMPLHTVYHAYVDGTSGDTFLNPVQARLGQSNFTTRGKVVVVKGKGHDIAMDVDIPHGRMQDFLELGVKTRPPLMNGILTMKGKLHVPPGDERVPEKMQLVGAFQLHDVRFNNSGIQDKVDGLSARAQGKPKEVAADSTDKQAEVSSAMAAKFELAHGLMNIHDLQYQIPGALVLLNGVYSTDGNVFEFKGHVRTQAEASQMVTGWKSWLLKPVDPFLKKNGAGLELPIAISGTHGDVHFGLALHGSAEESNQAMAADLKSNRQEMLEQAKTKRERDKEAAQEKKAGQTTDGEQTKAERKAEKERRKAERHEAKAKVESEPAAGTQTNPTAQAPGQKPSPDVPQGHQRPQPQPQ